MPQSMHLEACSFKILSGNGKINSSKFLSLLFGDIEELSTLSCSKNPVTFAISLQPLNLSHFQFFLITHFQNPLVKS